MDDEAYERAEQAWRAATKNFGVSLRDLSLAFAKIGAAVRVLQIEELDRVQPLASAKIASDLLRRVKGT